MKKRNYSKEFKDHAVRLSYQRDNIKDLANELGITAERIYRWRRISREGLITKKVNSISNEDSLEVKRLRKALKEKELELEILKKAVHIFSKSDGRFINL